MKKSNKFKKNESGRERSSRRSLTLALSLFVFFILLAAIALAILGLWLMAKLGLMVDVDGDLQLSKVILFVSMISLIIGGVIAYFSSRLPLKAHKSQQAWSDFLTALCCS